MFRALIVAVVLVLANAASHAETITVSAAVSLKESLWAIAREYTALTGDKVEFNFGASGQLMLQIRQGAPVDAFVSAAERQVAQLRKEGVLADAAERVIACNDLVLIVPADGKGIDSFQSLASPEVKRIAIGQPQTVPAGEYATEVLQKLKIETAVKDRLVYGANVRQVLDYVIRGEVDAGIVYSSDAYEAGDRAKVLAVAEKDWHQPIVYPAVIIRASTKQQAAERFLAYLMTDKPQAIFLARGFISAEKGSGR